jgi:hypothetical protein
MVETKYPDLHTTTNHHNAIVLDTVVEVDDQGHYDGHMIIYATETPEIQSPKHRSTYPTEMGAACFTHRVHRTLVPKGFKLPHDQQKYDGSQEPESWLSDYLQAVKILGGSKATTMQSLQLHLTSATQSWFNKLPAGTIGS